MLFLFQHYFFSRICFQVFDSVAFFVASLYFVFIRCSILFSLLKNTRLTK